jgi:hypothetical protein
VGARNRSNESLLRSQPTEGAYLPSSSDAQALVSYQFSDKWTAEFLGNYSRTRFSFIPKSTQLTAAVYTPYVAKTWNADIRFSGQERDAYITAMTGVAATYQVRKNVRLKWLASRFQNQENENVDITGAYELSETEVSVTSPSNNDSATLLGAGINQVYARNALNITNYNLSHRGTWERGKSVLLWGFGIDRTSIEDNLHEWEFNDSAGYSLPYNTGGLNLNKVVRSAASLNVYKYNGFVQNNLASSDSAHAFTLQTGLRFNYNDLNRELLIAPRVNASWKPDWKKDIVFKMTLGAYHQPP